MLFSLIAEWLKQNDRYLILTHRRPDGDTLGSAAALCRGLRLLGKTACVLPNEDTTPRYAFLCRDLLAEEGYQFDKVIALDTASPAQLPPSSEHLLGRIDLNIDHHPSNSLPAPLSLVEPRAAATGELIWQIFAALELKLDVEIYTALYTSVATDTGCFRFSNTTPLSHRIAADAIEAGCAFHPLNRALFDTKTEARFSIEQYLFSNLQFFADKRIAAIVISRQLIDELGADQDDIENLSSLTMQLDIVKCGIVLIEAPEGDVYKASVRTQAPFSANEICLVFGGGGHARAAGCSLDGPPEAALQTLVEEATRHLSDTSMT